MARLPYRPAAAEVVPSPAARADRPAATHSRPRHPAGRAPAHPAPGVLAARQIGHICAPERRAPMRTTTAPNGGYRAAVLRRPFTFGDGTCHLHADAAG